MTAYMITGNARETRAYLLRASNMGIDAIEELIETGAYKDGEPFFTEFRFYELEDSGDDDGVMITKRTRK